MMRDLASRLVPVQIFGPATLDADNTPAALDLAGCNSAVILLSVGIGGITFTSTNKVEFKLTHSEDNVTYDAVTSDDVQGVTVASGGILRSLTAAKAAADTAPTEVGYIGGRRYLKLLADFGGTHSSGTPMSAVLVKGNSVYKP